MRSPGLAALAACSLLIVAGCSGPTHGARGAGYPAGGARPLPSPVAPVGAPLPAGWAWPVDLGAYARGLVAPGVYRPVDVAALARGAARGGCAPVQVTPTLWISLPCGELPRLSDSAFVPRAQLRPSAGLPPSVDLRQLGLDGPVKDQQSVGVCWSFALSTLLDNAARRAGRQDVLAPLHVIASGVWDTMRSGRSNRALVTEPSWPYDPVQACKLNERDSEVWCDDAYHVRHGSWREDPALVASVDLANASGTFRIQRVESLASSPGDPDEVATALAQGRAVYAGFAFNSSAWGHGAVADGVIDDYTASSSGHAVALVGYRQSATGRQFLLHNSWGNDWADHGYAWISERMVREQMHDAFILDAAPTTVAPTPAPAPSPAVTPALPWPWSTPAAGACTTGQVRDLVLGVCAAPCAGGAPPVAGLCVAGAANSGAPSPAPSPSPTPATGCPQGQLPDFVTAQCAPQCRTGLPPAAGLCWP